MKIRENVLIAELTTMRLGGAAHYVLEIETRNDIEKAVQFAEENGLPIWVMGGGANTIGHDEGFDGVVILNRMKGIETLDETSKSVLLKGMSGEVWDDFVEFACEKNYSGIELLSLVPGTVGAAPVQNIGAYGQDISDVIVEVEAYDLRKNQFVTIPKSEMKMSYRTTIFNHGADAGRYLIIAVTVRLQKSQLEPPFYNSLQRKIDLSHETNFAPRNLRKLVSEIRNEKLPDPAKVASAGSFFKNIQLDKTAAEVAEQHEIPVWRNDDGSGKINSGWLIEQCGLRGKELFGFRVSDKAALVLINESATSYHELAQARAEIIKQVQDKFGYILEQEPVEMPSGR